VTQEPQADFREAPLGFFDGKVDEKGRGKLPMEVRRYAVGPHVPGEPDPALFVTSLDGRTIKLYPISKWREIEKKLEEEREKAKAAKQTLLLAKTYGGAATVDSSNRFLIPTLLRRKLELSGDGASVFYDCSQGFVTVYSQKLLDQDIHQAEQNAEANMDALASLGIR